MQNSDSGYGPPTVYVHGVLCSLNYHKFSTELNDSIQYKAELHYTL